MNKQYLKKGEFIMDIDKNKLTKQLAEENRARKAALDNRRATLLKTLNEAGIKRVTGAYEHHTHSGYSEVTKLEPEGLSFSDEDRESLRNLIWDFVMRVLEERRTASRGYYDYTWGAGEFKWTMNDNRIDINHTKIGDGVNTDEEHQDI